MLSLLVAALLQPTAYPSTQHPFAVIGPDYGLLSEENRAESTKRAIPSAFDLADINMAYPYWRCFHKAKVSVQCSDMGEQNALPVFVVETENETQEYLFRRVWSHDDCIGVAMEWRKHSKENTACFAGQFIRTELNSNHPHFSWIFDRYKTRKGCYGYFDDCDSTVQ